MLEEIWKLGVLRRRLGPAGAPAHPMLFDEPAVAKEDMPALLSLKMAEHYSWDLKTHRAAPRQAARIMLDAIEDPSIGLQTFSHIIMVFTKAACAAKWTQVKKSSEHE